MLKLFFACTCKKGYIKKNTIHHIKCRTRYNYVFKTKKKIGATSKSASGTELELLSNIDKKKKNAQNK